MAVFSYIYYNNYVARSAVTVAAVMNAALKLGPPQQVGAVGCVCGGGWGCCDCSEHCYAVSRCDLVTVILWVWTVCGKAQQGVAAGAGALTIAVLPACYASPAPAAAGAFGAARQCADGAADAAHAVGGGHSRRQAGAAIARGGHIS